MNFFDAQSQLPALAQGLVSHPGLVIVCYCAAWCDTCRQYREGFESLAQDHPSAVFIWVDIEENETLLDDEEVEDFPTLLVQSSQGNLFFGPMPPHPTHLDRLIRSLEGDRPVIHYGPGDFKRLAAATAQ